MRRLDRRFRTWYFVAAASGSAVVLNSGEHEAAAWLAPARALARHAAGDMLLVPPTWVTLHHLAGSATVARALAAAAAGPVVDYLSYQLTDDVGPHGRRERAVVVWAGDEAYPPGGRQAPAGGRHRLDTSALPWTFEWSPAHD
ncbi:hypothetical protein [Specibacter cremeus]|uniref:hypothetical protein n=1 Tax=Specibacter cremeus TaxID=1629051 RepID=UPI0013DDB929|nr:hypothetical protein [Specibacter cremeus]